MRPLIAFTLLSMATTLQAETLYQFDEHSILAIGWDFQSDPAHLPTVSPATGQQYVSVSYEDLWEGTELSGTITVELQRHHFINGTLRYWDASVSAGDGDVVPTGTSLDGTTVNEFISSSHQLERNALYPPGVHIFDYSTTVGSGLTTGYRVSSSLSVRPILPGDSNGDFRVDGFDYLRWAENYDWSGEITPYYSFGNGDFDKNGTTDGLDYLLWASWFGTYEPEEEPCADWPDCGAVAVPEPSSLVLLLLGMLMCRRLRHV